MKSKILTIDDANRMLPLLRTIVRDIRCSWEMIITKRTELECIEKEKNGGPPRAEPLNEDPERLLRLDRLKAELNALIERINNYIREVEDLGCFVEEFKRGIVNFPCLLSGRKVFLCWGLEEDRVQHWHELDESYNDRVPIRQGLSQ